MSSNTNSNAANTGAKVRFSNYLKGVRSEMRKVHWPNKKELINYTGVVILISLIVALIVYIIDLLIGGVITLVV